MGIWAHIQETLRLPTGEWNLHAVMSVRTLTIMRNEEQNVKGATLAIVNKGGGTAIREMVGDLECISDRLHQMQSGRVTCHPQSCTGGNRHNHAIMDCAREIQLGIFLVRNKNRIDQERIALARSAAFGTARIYTSNAEQKHIARWWRDTGANDFRKMQTD